MTVEYDVFVFILELVLCPDLIAAVATWAYITTFDEFTFIPSSIIYRKYLAIKINSYASAMFFMIQLRLSRLSI